MSDIEIQGAEQPSTTQSVQELDGENVVDVTSSDIVQEIPSSINEKSDSIENDEQQIGNIPEDIKTKEEGSCASSNEKEIEENLDNILEEKNSFLNIESNQKETIENEKTKEILDNSSSSTNVKNDNDQKNTEILNDQDELSVDKHELESSQQNCEQNIQKDSMVDDPEPKDIEQTSCQVNDLENEMEEKKQIAHDIQTDDVVASEDQQCEKKDSTVESPKRETDDEINSEEKLNSCNCNDIKDKTENEISEVELRKENVESMENEQGHKEDNHEDLLEQPEEVPEENNQNNEKASESQPDTSSSALTSSSESPEHQQPSSSSSLDPQSSSDDQLNPPTTPPQSEAQKVTPSTRRSRTTASGNRRLNSTSKSLSMSYKRDPLSSSRNSVDPLGSTFDYYADEYPSSPGFEYDVDGSFKALTRTRTGRVVYAQKEKRAEDGTVIVHADPSLSEKGFLSSSLGTSDRFPPENYETPGPGPWGYNPKEHLLSSFHASSSLSFSSPKKWAEFKDDETIREGDFDVNLPPMDLLKERNPTAVLPKDDRIKYFHTPSMAPGVGTYNLVSEKDHRPTSKKGTFSKSERKSSWLIRQ
ncbi:uncharacterized protein MONOS_5807 [Monocercomonoides exilis]|uniref:uncharacterized protein n=1 Tax=Monocercomonoides exilis TaxID=2049356 RepID=UPI003559A861|nr:hypothetical protein MONOS_5807 [Monocercomonoides exilis]|eukprot:MONOS_5807.1-p1 / transcript=MONOS_5807.1 / gene=MONOS_5807 / organism=Monocercomonoides_exilis_PA203 / gene_product=unspecified product / transcript_product=unspecified product / location=Mono_scaffold00174:52254-54127(+) / protein_length=589 / sequence_SO=supercontig / SO=protein_coding / is_pseudo=false